MPNHAIILSILLMSDISHVIISSVILLMSDINHAIIWFVILLCVILVMPLSHLLFY